jgi:hypothetical protein
MMKDLRFYWHVLLGIGLALALSFYATIAHAQTPSYDPDQFLSPMSSEVLNQVSPCVPGLSQTTEQHVLQSAIDQETGIAYYTIRVNLSTSLARSLTRAEGGLIPEAQRPWSVTVSYDAVTEQCTAIVPRGAMQAPWLTLMPESVANQFTLQDLKYQSKLFQALGDDPNQVFQERIDNLALSRQSLSPDQAWAFQQLGFSLPSSITILDPRTRR